MKARALVLAWAASFVVLAPPALASTPKKTTHHKKTVSAVAKAKPTTVKPSSVETLPPTVTSIVPTTIPSQDPNSLDCTYMICSSLGVGAGSTTAVVGPLTASTGTPEPSSTDTAPISQFCVDNSYMC
jgi:hypothetical protein